MVVVIMVVEVASPEDDKKHEIIILDIVRYSTIHSRN